MRSIISESLLEYLKAIVIYEKRSRGGATATQLTLGRSSGRAQFALDDPQFAAKTAWANPFVSLVYTLRNAVSLGLSDLDAWLLKQPLFGPVYERFFRKDTYYRQDTRLMYLTVVESVVKKLVEEETAAKGVKLLTQYEYGPILGELYKARPFGSGTKLEAT